ncbi:MAG: molybdopterin molybdotransferase [Halobacteriales archaeon]|jgi:molybdopterin molybdotransferase
MNDTSEDITEAGFKDRTRIDEAREALRTVVSKVDRSEFVGLDSADGRALAESVRAELAVPHYPRAAMDGYAVRAESTFGASERSPTVLREIEEGPVQGDDAVRVHTGSELPDGADAVVKVEDVERVGDEIEVFDAAAEGENVGPVGEDVEARAELYEPGHQLRPSDLGLLKSTGIETVAVRERPRVSVIPTGEELVQSDPDPGEVIETNGLTVSNLVRRWGGEPSYRDVVTDDRETLREAVERDLDHDVVVTTGGSSVGERDLIPEVIDEMGEVMVHGVALKPGHPVALGVVGETPVIMLPGFPVACIVNAVQFLRPAVKWAGDLRLTDPPTFPARLDRKIPSEPGIRTFARVSLETKDGERVAVPTRASGSGILSSVALADGWIEIREGVEGLPEDDIVAVQDWEWLP